MYTRIRLECDTLDAAQQARARLIGIFGDSVELGEPRKGRKGGYLVYGRLGEPTMSSAYRLGESMGIQSGYRAGEHAATAEAAALLQSAALALAAAYPVDTPSAIADLIERIESLARRV